MGACFSLSKSDSSASTTNTRLLHMFGDIKLGPALGELACENIKSIRNVQFGDKFIVIEDNDDNYWVHGSNYNGELG